MILTYKEAGYFKQLSEEKGRDPDERQDMGRR